MYTEDNENKVEDQVSWAEVNINRKLNDERTLEQIEERNQRRLDHKPQLDHLEDAVIMKDDNLIFLQEKGSVVIIERTASMLKSNTWLDTRHYVVHDVNQDTGALRLWDDEVKQHAFSNFKEGIKLGYKFKIPARKGAIIPRKSRKPREKEQKEESTVTVEEKAAKQKRAGTRRIYLSKEHGIHTRIKMIAYAPVGETKAVVHEKLAVSFEGKNLKVQHESGWSEIWVPTKF